MLRIYFGERENTIDNTSVYFKHSFQGEWMNEDFAKNIIMDIDHSKVEGPNSIISPILGNISPMQLSRGVKTLILMKHFPHKIFNGSNCGDNCAKWILKLGEEQDFTINLFHVMDFGSGTFDIRVLNDKKLIVHNMEELLGVGVKYLRKASA